MIGYPQTATDQWWQRQVDKHIMERDEARDERDRMREALVKARPFIETRANEMNPNYRAICEDNAFIVLIEIDAALGTEEKER